MKQLLIALAIGIASSLIAAGIIAKWPWAHAKWSRLWVFLRSIEITTRTRVEARVDERIEREIPTRVRVAVDEGVRVGVDEKIADLRRQVRPARWIVMAEQKSPVTATLENNGGPAYNVSVHPGEGVSQIISAGSWSEIEDTQPRAFNLLFDKYEALLLMSGPTVYIQWVDEAGSGRDGFVPILRAKPDA